MIITDFDSGKSAKVNDQNRLLTDTISKFEQQDAIDKGNAYNLNTGQVSITQETAMIYLKNNESLPLFIDAIAVGIGKPTGGNATFTDNVEITIIRNPKAGTVISGATDIPININRNFGSSNELTADAYVAADGETITDGDDALLIAQNGQGRVFAGVGIELDKGNSVGVKVNPNLDATSVEVYVAIICHLEQKV